MLKCRPKARVSKCASLRHLCPWNVCKLPAYRQNLREVRLIYQVTTESQKQVSVPRWKRFFGSFSSTTFMSLRISCTSCRPPRVEIKFLRLFNRQLICTWSVRGMPPNRHPSTYFLWSRPVFKTTSGQASPPALRSSSSATDSRPRCIRAEIPTTAICWSTWRHIITKLTLPSKSTIALEIILIFSNQTKPNYNLAKNLVKSIRSGRKVFKLLKFLDEYKEMCYQFKNFDRKTLGLALTKLLAPKYLNGQ